MDYRLAACCGEGGKTLEGMANKGDVPGGWEEGTSIVTIGPVNYPFVICKLTKQGEIGGLACTKYKYGAIDEVGSQDYGSSRQPHYINFARQL